MMAGPATPRSPLLELNDLRMHFPIRKGAFRHVVGHVKAVDGVSLRVEDGETLGIVGEIRLRQVDACPHGAAHLPAHEW
ncbi:ABC-type microcin C transport system duplicated ATPase subunit YejF [Rhizobium pisi]